MLSVVRAATIEDLSPRKLFKDVSTRTLREFLDKGQIYITELYPDQSLKYQRDNIGYVYLILSGYLAVRMESYINEGRSFLLGIRGPEQIVGEMKAISEESDRVLIEAREECRLIEIPTEALIWIAEMDGRIYRNIAALLVEKSLQEHRRTEVVQMPRISAQVAQTLLNFLDERGRKPNKEGGWTINGIIKQSDIAAYIGCQRETVSRILSELKKQRILSYPSQGRNSAPRITVNDLERLHRIVRE